MAPDGLQEAFGGISETWSEYGPKWSPGGHLEAFPSTGQNMAPNGLQEIIWKHF